MNHCKTSLILIACSIISVCTTARYACADKPETSLAAAARAAKAQLRPLTEADAQDAKKELIASIDRLNENLEKIRIMGMVGKHSAKSCSFSSRFSSPAVQIWRC